MVSFEFLGMMAVAIVTLASLIGVVFKCYKPIEKLNISIVQLNSNIEMLLRSSNTHDKRLNAHSSKIDEINQKLWEHAGALDTHNARIKQLEHERERGDI
ncbi:MAG TPA: hypothetical protein H9900_04950 [Candidatus Monoglobus merdigallinarum]|uniref:Uncharacterized protein n=1 Tax=Candidatus Monoglobus merdigallinarum TaxID=2838698 RepID=A0A9D1PSL4_9FIRM|nr:hypothetical protein [Candidatus Monoglobus merdigallinarum]